MDRSEEFARIVGVFRSAKGNASPEQEVVTSTPSANSAYTNIGARLCSFLDNNDVLIGKMRMLADRKEFSNDPTAALAEMSQQFQEGVSKAQNELSRLKNMSEGSEAKNSRAQQQQQQHRRLQIQGLNKRLTAHMETFQVVLKAHSANVKARSLRVDRYGAASSVATAPAHTLGAAGRPVGANSAYAMFQTSPRTKTSLLAGTSTENSISPPSAAGTLTGGLSAAGAELRKRGGAGLPSGSSAASPPPTLSLSYTNRRSEPFGAPNSAYSAGGVLSEDDSQAKGAKNQQQSQAYARAKSRLHGAERIEAAIAQVGGLFTQMASLVAEQGETLSRIEDDVECGLEQIESAHSEMEYFYEITKGNRSVIIKIFLLLFVFAYIFLRLT